jgi:hypothetical protein
LQDVLVFVEECVIKKADKLFTNLLSCNPFKECVLVKGVLTVWEVSLIGVTRLRHKLWIVDQLRRVEAVDFIEDLVDVHAASL